MTCLCSVAGKRPQQQLLVLVLVLLLLVVLLAVAVGCQGGRRACVSSQQMFHVTGVCSNHIAQVRWLAALTATRPWPCICTVCFALL